jgi:tetratricopeptide (TPR) repeat protein
MCWSKALANVALERALDECNRSIAKEDYFAAHDSKAVTLLRLSRVDEAIAEFNLALKNGDVPAALYGRSIAYARKGDRAKSDADAAEALKKAPRIERDYAFYGLTR